MAASSQKWWEQDPELLRRLQALGGAGAGVAGQLGQAASGVGGQLAANAFPGGNVLYGAGQAANQARQMVPSRAADQAPATGGGTYGGTTLQDYAPQYPTTPGYTAPAAPGTAAGGTTGAAPAQQYPSTVPAAPAATPYNPTYGAADIDPQSALEQGRASMMRQLRARGINPYGGNPVVNALLERVGDIINANIGSLQGRNDPIQALQELLSGAVQRAMTGKAVFPSAGTGMDPMAALSGVAARVNAAQEGGQQPNLGDAFIAQILSNPRNAAAVASDTLFGGQGATFSKIGAQQMADVADLYRQIQGDIGPENLQPGAPGFLDWLIQRRGQTGRAADTRVGQPAGYQQEADVPGSFLETMPLDSGDYYDLFYANEPQAAYARWLNSQQWGGGNLGQSNAPLARYAQGQAGEEYRQYLARAPELGPSTTFFDFLDTRGPSIQQRFRTLSPSQGGMDWGKSTKTLRWVL